MALAMVSANSVLSFWANRSFFLIGELLLGNLSKTVVVHGNAPHDRPGFLVGHLIGNRASLSAMAGRRNDLCVVVGSSGGPPPSSPPAEKATARQDQTGQSSTDVGNRNSRNRGCEK